MCGVCCGKIIVSHATFQFLRINICEEPNLCRGAAGYAIQDIWKSRLRPEDRIKLFSKCQPFRNDHMADVRSEIMSIRPLIDFPDQAILHALPDLYPALQRVFRFLLHLAVPADERRW